MTSEFTIKDEVANILKSRSLRESYDTLGLVKRITTHGVYVTKDEVLRISSASSVSSANILRVQARILRLWGSIDSYDFRITPNVNRTIQNNDFDIGTGYLLSVRIFINSSGSIFGGDLYAFANLFNTKENYVTFTLCRGYPTNLDIVYFPNGPNRQSLDGRGRVQTFVGSDPAAGAEISQNPPSGAFWRVYAMAVQFVTDANVATRRVILILGATESMRFDSQTTQAASLTRDYRFNNYQIQPAANNTFIYTAVPFPIDVPNTTAIKTVTENIQVGDNYGAPVFYVEEWLYV